MKTFTALLAAAKNYQDFVDDADGDVVERTKEALKKAICAAKSDFAPSDKELPALTYLHDALIFTDNISCTRADKIVEAVNLLGAGKSEKVAEILETAGFNWLPDLKEEEGQW